MVYRRSFLIVAGSSVAGTDDVSHLLQEVTSRAVELNGRLTWSLEEVWSAGSWHDRREAWSRVPALVDWLGSERLTPIQMSNLRARITVIGRRLAKPIRYLLKDQGGFCPPGRWAWHAGGLQPRTIRLCPPFLAEASTPDLIDRQAAVVVHEIAHGLWRLWVPGTRIGLIPGTMHPRGTRTALHARELARSHPTLARVSPTNLGLAHLATR